MCDKVQIFGNNTNRSEFHELRDEEQTKFGPEFVAFPPDV
jgi:hypothetical protein